MSLKLKPIMFPLGPTLPIKAHSTENVERLFELWILCGRSFRYHITYGEMICNIVEYMNVCFVCLMICEDYNLCNSLQYGDNEGIQFQNGACCTLLGNCLNPLYQWV